jgi:hypothetical protein
MVKNADGKMVEGNAADKAGGIGISLSLGASSSQSQQQSNADSAKGSKVNAGGNVTITATGAGKDSDITVQGSNIEAGKATSLKADEQVKLLAAQNTTQESSSNQSKSGSIGLAMQLGAGGGGGGFTASASKATGQGAGNSTTYTNSQVAGNTVNIESGGDTNLKGAVVKGEQVTAKVGGNPFGSGGNLNIESLQDTNQYKESSKSAGGSIMVGAGVSGSVNLVKSKVNSDYLSVGEQSAIRAGDGGFQVNVQGKTTLTGGQITSTQAAVDQNKNSYEAKQGSTTTDLSNSASYSANSVSVGIGAGTLPGKSASAGMSGVGLGSDKGSASSTTTAGISGVAGNTQARTGDKGTSIAPIFNKDQVQKEVAAQVAITSEFGKQASKAVGDTAQQKMQDANKKLADAQTAEATGDSAKAEQLRSEAKQLQVDWGDNGKMLLAAHTVIGGLTGGASGAAGAAVGTLTAPAVADALNKAGVDSSLAKGLTALASTAAGAAVGGTNGAATAFNEVMNNYLKHADVQAMSKDMTACKTKSGGCSDQDTMAILTKYREVSNQNIAQVQACITSGDVSCVQKLEAQAAPAGAIDAAIPLGYGAQSRELMGRQNNVIAFGSVKGGASLFGTDAQQAKEVADFRNANCSSLSVSACNTLVNQAMDDRMTRAGILMAAGALTPVAVNGLRTLSVPKAGASTETLSSGKTSATAKARVDNNANADVSYAGGVPVRPRDGQVPVGTDQINTPIAKHLIDVEIKTFKGQPSSISGGHNMDNFNQAVRANGGQVQGAPKEVAPGIFEIEYKMPGTVGKNPTKTVYDPAKYSDAQMASMANEAVGRAIYQWNKNGGINSKEFVEINGVKFEVPISSYKGQVYVPTAYPSGR